MTISIVTDLQALLEKTTGSDFLREVEPQSGSTSFTTKRLMDLEVEGLTGASHGGRGADQLTQNNG